MDRAEGPLAVSSPDVWMIAEAELGTAAFVWDVATDACVSTDGFCELHGIDAAEGVTRETALAAVHPQDRHLWLLDNLRLAQSGGAYAREFRVLRPGGEARRVLGVGRVTTDGEGRPRRMVGTLTDLSWFGHDARTEAALRRVLEAAPIGIAQVQSDATFAYYNKSFCEVLGQSSDALVGESFHDLFLAEDRSENLACFARLLAGEVDRYVLEKRLRRAGGDAVWARISVSAVRETDAHLRYAVAVVENVTERRDTARALEEALRRSELLLNELEHRVANNLQLLTSVLSLQARQAEASVQAALSKARQQIVMISSLHRMLRADQSDVRRIAFDAYLASIVDALRESHDLEQRGISIEMETAALTVCASQAVTFGLIVNELATNALKHAFVGRREGRIAVSLSRDGDEVVLSVADDGIGFDREAVGSGDGSKLVAQLTRSLRGALEIDASASGATWRMRFDAALFEADRPA